MGITLFAVGALMAPLNQWLGSWSRRAAPPRPSRPARPLAASGPAVRARAARVVPAPGARNGGVPPLRVRRVAEPLQGRASAGRMVISGRMADVCAEIDRLAGLETAPTGREAAFQRGMPPVR